MKRILVCGGRDFANPIPYDHSSENKPAMDEYKFLFRTLDRVVDERGWNYPPDPTGHNYLPDVTIISGKARGADSAAIDWAIVNWCPVLEFPADWKKHGRAAGPIRNQEMLDIGKPDLVIAFPGGDGTADMVRRSKKAGIEVLEIKYDNNCVCC